MNCEIGIHEAFIELKQIICPFCKQPLEDEKKRDNTDESVKTSNCTSKDHRDKIKVPDPVVKDLISSKL